MGIIGSRVSRSLTEVRNFLRADSAEELVRLQLQTNLKHGLSFSFTDFMVGPDGKFYCWYLVDLEDSEKDVIDGDT